MPKYTFKKIFQEVKRYKKELILANIIALIAVIISTPIPLFMPVLVDEVLLKKPGFLIKSIDSLFGSHQAYFYVLIILVLVILLRTLFFILNFFQTKLFTKISKNITYKIREEVLNHLSKISLNKFEFLGSGKVASMLLVDVDTIDNFLGTIISRLIISVLTILGVGIILLMIHWKLALFILCLNPLVVLLTTKIARKVSKLKKIQNKSYEVFADSLNETLDLFMQIKAANKEKRFFGKVINDANTLRENAINFDYKSDAASRFSFLIFLSGFELFRASSILVVAYSDLSIGLMLAIFGYLWVMMSPIQEIINMQYAYHNANAALQRINFLFSLELEPTYRQDKDPFANNFTNAVKMTNINFSYENGKEILNVKNLEAKRGQKIAIIGASGSGKTTLAQLLVGLYPLQEGDILYEDASIKEIGLDKVRENVYLVLQNPQLFNDTIKNNLLLGHKITNEELRAALKLAQLDDFIDSLENGLDTQVGKHGIKLSGGQRQRLSIARMIIQNPNIIILDESTSALDVHTESRLFNELEEYFKGKTMIIIAHRLSTIRKADYIYVLDYGKVIEEGTSESLMQQEGLFYSYINKFSKDNDNED
jgi:ATP-binding cassette, subfamily C, bacterial